MSRRFGILSASFISVVLLCAGCAAADDTTKSAPASTAPSAPAPSPSPTPTPSLTDVPDASAASAPVTCESLLDQATLDDLAQGTFGLPDQESIDGYVAKTRDEGNPMALLADYGGVLCPVTNGTRVSELFGFTPITAEQSSEQRSRLKAEGATESSFLGGTLYVGAATGESVAGHDLFVDNAWFIAVDQVRLAEIVANRPAS